MSELAAATDAVVGTAVGRYVIRRVLGRGGMGTVYLAQLAGARGFRKWVALKLVHPHLAEDRRFVTMFLDEARVAARIHHPSACATLDFGEDGGVPYLVMEYLHGESLSTVLDVLDARPVGERQLWLIARVLADAARGLDAAHSLLGDDGLPLGVVHRDVSPHNVAVLYDGHSKVLDFGIARARGRISLTEPGEVKGKIAYAAPEHLRGDPVDRTFDVWSLGVTLWEAATGERLFKGESDAQTVANVLGRAIVPPSRLVRGFPDALDRATLAALERDPTRRTPTAAAFAEALDDYLSTLPRPTGPGQIAKWMQAALSDRLAMRNEWLSGTGPERSSTRSRSRPIVAAGDEDTTDDGAVAAPEPAPRRPRRKVGIAAALLTVLATAAAAVALVSALDGAAPLPPSDRARGGAGASAPPPSPIEQRSEDVTAPLAGRTEPTRAHVANGPAIASESRAPRQRSRRRTPRAVAPAPVGAPGKLNLLAIPRAEVFWNGVSLGRTPLVERSMPAGRHVLLVRELGGSRERSVAVVVAPARTTARTVRLE